MKKVKKVKIVKCSKESWWYNDRIGEIFNVTLDDDYYYIIVNNANDFCYILVTDCIDITIELKLERILNESKNN